MGQQGPLKARNVASSTALYEALTALGRGEDGTAREAAGRAVAAQPADPFAWESLATASLRDGDPAAAVEAAERALALNPDSVAVHALMGAGLKALGRLSEAEPHLNQAVTARPDNAEAWRDLAACLAGLNRLDEAREALGRALAVAPDDAAAHGALGALQRRAGWPLAAEAASRRAVDLAPDTAAWRFDLANALRDQGRLDEAEVLYRKALDAAPDDVSGHSALLACLNYQPERSAAEIFTEYRRWEARHGRHVRTDASAFENTPTPERRLRIGYVSPDFREHAVRHVLEPLLSAHDRSQVEVFCYAERSGADGATELLRSLADDWIETGRLDDQALADRIVRDRIDILVDFGGHGRAGRLPVFARRPAPVQLAHMLGGGYTSGLSVMDGFLGDAALVPPGTEALFAEPIIRLARIPLAYAPDPAMPEPTPSPALSRGFTTYGYFGPVEAINAQVVETWAEILKRAPGAALSLHARAFAEPEFRVQILGRFTAHDIEPERIQMRPVSGPAAWSAHGQVDVVLDPFPHNADRSTIEALWLGVPVLSVLDRPSVGRLGASILGAVGLSDWVARDLDDYVVKAVAAAHYPEGPAALRSVLRDRFRASPLADAAGLARELEDVYRALWRGWCAQAPAPQMAPASGVGETPDISQAPVAPTPVRQPNPPAAPGPATAELHRLFATGDLAGADGLADRVIDAGPGPDLAEGWHVKGLVALRRGDLAAAQVAIEQSLALSPQASVWSNLGAVRRGAGRLVEAEAAYRAALALDPDLADARRNLVNLLAASGRLDEAAIELTETVARAAAPAEPLERLGDVLAHLGRAAESADAYGRTLSYAPDAPGVRRKLALMLDRSGRTAEAADALAVVLQGEPGDASAWTEFSDLQRRLGHGADAERSARRSLSLDTDSAAAFNTLGAALAVQDRWDEAGQAFEQALARDPEMAAARHNRDLALAKATEPRPGSSAPAAAPPVFEAPVGEAPPAPADPRADHLKSLFTAGDLAGAVDFAQSVLAAEPDHPDAHHILGLVAYRHGEFAGAATSIRRSLAARPDPHAWANLGASLRWVGDLDAAEAAYRRALAMAPELNDIEAGLAALLADRRPTAPASEAVSAPIASYDKLATSPESEPVSDPDHVRGLHLQGLIAFRQGRLEAAAEAVAQAVDASPEVAELRWDLATILRAQGRLEAACAQGREAVTLAPHSAAAHAALGAVLHDLGWGLEAETTLHRALSLDPLAPDAWTHLAVLLRSQGRATEAESAAKEAVRLNPRDASAHHQLGLARIDQDAYAGAAEAFAAAVKLRPDLAGSHSMLLACLNHRSDLSPETLRDAQRVWAARHAARLAPPRPPTRRDRAAGERLRIGYVASRFRREPRAALIEPVLAAHDRRLVEIVGYAEVARPDAVTERFRALCDLWRPTAGLSDEAVAQQIRDDGIDVLIDLSGHGEGARPLVFARRPAPVQLAWLALTGQSSGLSVMDATLGDASLAPHGTEALLSEPLLRMKTAALAWRPSGGAGPVTAAPCLRKGWITFAGLARGAGLEDPLLDAWAAILRTTPGARLHIDHRTLAEEAGRRTLAERFVARGVETERLALGSAASERGPWAGFGEVDIALDAFPHNTDPGLIEALWMGVPVVTLAGRAPGARFGAAVLTPAGLSDWIASDIADYVARAVAAAAHPIALARTREGLRDRLRASGVLDAARLARSLEAIYLRFDARRAGAQARPAAR